MLSPPLPPFDKSDFSKVVGMYVLVPAAKYPKWAAAGVIGWAAKVLRFVSTKGQKSVYLKIEGDNPAKFQFGSDGKHVWNLLRLT